MIWGTQTELKVVLVSLLVSIGVGVPLGLFSGYFGGKLDRVLVLIMDALLVFPFLLLAIVIAFLLSDKVGQGILTAAIAITVVYIPLYFRVVRNHTISIREEPFVEAARALGARPLTIIRKYVFFNVVQNVPPLATLNAADAILTLAALGFLGYGIQPTEGAEWGYDVNRAVSDAASGIWWTGPLPRARDRAPRRRSHPARRGAQRDDQPGAPQEADRAVDLEAPPTVGDRTTRDGRTRRLGARSACLLRHPARHGQGGRRSHTRDRRGRGARARR